jgi:hypothetical protein
MLAGGHAFYDYEIDEHGGLDLAREPRVPSWLCRNLGEDFFSDIVTVFVDTHPPRWATQPHDGAGCSGSEAAAALLRRLHGLPGLKSLVLRGPQVGDYWAGQLSDMTALTEVRFVHTNVSKEGVDRLCHALPSCRVTVVK